MGNMEINSTDDSEAATQKKKFKIDFESLFAADRHRPPDGLVVISNGDLEQQTNRQEKRKKSKGDSLSTSASVAGQNLARLSVVADLASCIESKTQSLAKLKGNLPDNGLQAEMEGRKLAKAEEDAGACKISVDLECSSPNGDPEGPELASTSSQASGRSKFATFITKNLEDNLKPKSESNIGDEASNAFESEFSLLNHCETRRRKPVGRFSKRSKLGLCSKEFSAWNPVNHSRNGGKYMSLNDLLNGASSRRVLPLRKGRPAGSFTDKDAAQPSSFDDSKNGKTVVLVDEEEPEVVQKKLDAERLTSSICEGKIYYPSREDPESLEIFFSELKCLEPGECLTSTIMNFYIRFLQELWSPRDRSHHNCYFFNTYFYSKLQNAVECQKSGGEDFFIKFRRWWRGVNIFQKAYIFLSINEVNHWSLVIICIFDEDDSGLIILHLDSLALHSSASIFRNIKSLLINEWEYLKEDCSTFDIPIPDHIWKYLPHSIDQKIIVVPRQTNHYDCGLFVLYYMECFINEAPRRLKRQDLSMFGKNWFKPQEASSLREKIKSLLLDAFYEAPREEFII